MPEPMTKVSHIVTVYPISRCTGTAVKWESEDWTVVWQYRADPALSVEVFAVNAECVRFLPQVAEYLEHFSFAIDYIGSWSAHGSLVCNTGALEKYDPEYDLMMHDLDVLLIHLVPFLESLVAGTIIGIEVASFDDLLERM